jgi:hypothetical protein
MTHNTSLSIYFFNKVSYSPGFFHTDRTVWQQKSRWGAINYIKYNSSKATLKVLRTFMELRERHDHLYPSHATLASMAKTSVASVKRAIEKLLALGVLRKAWRSHDTCHYYINSALFEPEMLKLIKSFFINFRWAIFSGELLRTKVVKKVQSKPDELLLIIKEENLNNNYINKKKLASPAVDVNGNEVIATPEKVAPDQLFRAMEAVYGSRFLREGNEERYRLEGQVCRTSGSSFLTKTELNRLMEAAVCPEVITPDEWDFRKEFSMTVPAIEEISSHSQGIFEEKKCIMTVLTIW